MKVQNLNNNISYKGLYFTKTAPIVKNNMHYSNLKGFNVSELGARYIEDNSSTLNYRIKKLFKENSLIKDMQRKSDIFVQYFGENYDDLFKVYESKLRLYILPEKDAGLTILDVFETDSRYDMHARNKLLRKLLG